MPDKKVAIILRTKNRPNYLKRAICSILSQTYKSYHVYVVNDGGSRQQIDDIFFLLSGEEKEKFSFIDLPVSTRRGGALSIGINSSSENYIHIHDDDDTLEPEFLEKTVAYLDKDREKSFSGVVTSNYDIGEKIINDEIIEVTKTDDRGKRCGVAVRFSLYLSGTTSIVPIALLFRREAIRLVGGVDPNMDYIEDNEFFIRLMQYADIGIIPEILCSYHWKESQDNGVGFMSSSSQECNYHSLIYKNKIIRDSLSGKGTLRDLQAQALKDYIIKDYQSNIIMNQMTKLNNSFMEMVTVMNELIIKLSKN